MISVCVEMNVTIPFAFLLLLLFCCCFQSVVEKEKKKEGKKKGGGKKKRKPHTETRSKSKKSFPSGTGFSDDPTTFANADMKMNLLEEFFMELMLLSASIISETKDVVESEIWILWDSSFPT